MLAPGSARAYHWTMVSLVHSDEVAPSSDRVDIAEGLNELIAQAERSLDLHRVYLFGSRSRGDARSDSDVDLAFEHGSSPAAWARFVNEALEQSSLLLDLDLVDLSSASPELRDRILREGELLRG
jgi:predicted nucleotidyltransferase